MYPNLKLQIWRMGLRQNRLARMVGIDETLLSKVINGFRKASPNLRQQLASLLGRDEDWLFEQSEFPARDYNDRHGIEQ